MQSGERIRSTNGRYTPADTDHTARAKELSTRALWACVRTIALVVGLAWVSMGCGASMAQEESTKSAALHYKMAVNHFGAGEVTQSIRELTATISDRPDHAEAHHLLGFIYMGRKQYPEAVRHFRTAMDNKADFFICQNNLGVAYLFMERWEDAASVFEGLRTATLYTSPWLAYANLGWAYYKMGRIHEAIEETKMALFLNPDMCLANNNLGIMYLERDDIDRASRALTESTELCPSYAEPHLHLGLMWAAQGDLTKARRHFRTCMELSPRSELGERCRQNAKTYR